MTQNFLKVLLVLVALFSPVFVVVPAGASSSQMLITEVQTGTVDNSGQEFSQQEFVEITNTSNDNLGVPAGLQVQYLSAANDGSGSPTAILGTLTSSFLSPNQSILLSHDGYLNDRAQVIFGANDSSSTGLLAKSGGHVRLALGGIQVDCVSWGSAVSIPNCDKISSLASVGQSIQRPLVNGLYDKSLGLQNVAPTSPGQLNLNATELPADDPPPSSEPSSCQGIKVDEILANPLGDDSGHEYIELYNPTDQGISLAGCNLKAGSRNYGFPEDEALAAGQYKAYYNDVTGLQLTNSGGTVQLVGVSDQPVDYPAAGDDQAWALINGVWQSTGQLTPNQSNLVSLVVNGGVVGTPSLTKTCDGGKYLNPATNRCKSPPAVTAPKVCAADQVRNAATGRCRKITTAAGTAKACAAGQQRNPTTNRCRKIITVNKTAVKQDKTDPKTKPSYYIMLAVTICIVGYGFYEYRQDLVTYWNKLRQKSDHEPSTD